MERVRPLVLYHYFEKKIIAVGGGRANGCVPGPRKETATSTAIFVIDR